MTLPEQLSAPAQPEVFVTSVDPRPVALADPAVAPRLAKSVRAYVALTKPRIIELLLVTTVPTMILAQDGLPSAWLVIATLIGGTLAAGSANTLNCYLDRDIDAVMTRTAHRPLVTGDVSPFGALAFGLVLGCASTIWLALFVNWLSAALALAAILFYVFVYTFTLKRRTPQNIVWGGAAGCMPVLIGWAAVTGSLSWAPWVLFAVIFFWTPPHYWPLSMRFREDYSQASVPMLPVVADNVTVAKKIVLYSWFMVASSLLLWPVAHTGAFYGAVAAVLGALFLAEAYRLLIGAKRGVSERELKPMRLFHGSITYLTLLFVAVALTPFVHF